MKTSARITSLATQSLRPIISPLYNQTPSPLLLLNNKPTLQHYYHVFYSYGDRSRFNQPKSHKNVSKIVHRHCFFLLRSRTRRCSSLYTLSSTSQSFDSNDTVVDLPSWKLILAIQNGLRRRLFDCWEHVFKKNCSDVIHLHTSANLVFNVILF